MFWLKGTQKTEQSLFSPLSVIYSQPKAFPFIPGLHSNITIYIHHYMLWGERKRDFSNKTKLT